MSKRLLALLLVGVVSLAGLTFAQGPPANDEPPVRLKKKKSRGDDKPMADPDKAEEKKKDEKKEDKKAEPREAEPVTPQEEEREVLQRVVSNVQRVGERLAKNDLGEATQQTQRDILKDLDSLIHRNENPPPQGGGQQDQNNGGGGGGGDNQDNKNQKGGGGQQNQKQQRGGQRSPKQQGSGQKSQGQSNGSQKSQSGGGGSGIGPQPGSGKKSDPQQPQPSTKTGKDAKAEQKPGGKNGKNGNGGGGGDKDDRARNKNADLDKHGVWGHLPQTLRAQMDAYSNPQPFIPKYDDLIKRYYKTISEQGRRKGE